MRVLVTRPEPGASETTRRLIALGHHVVSDPMLRIVETGLPLPAGDFDAIAFTSLNGVRALAQHADWARVGQMPAFAVGSRTAAEARRLGFSEVTDSAGDLAALSETLIQRLTAGSRVLHAAGRERAGDLSPALAAHGIAVVAAVLYESRPADVLSPDTIRELQAHTLDAALHFSPRTVTALLHGVAAADVTGPFLRLRQLCLSQAVAAQFGSLGAAVEVAAAPNEDALLTLL